MITNIELLHYLDEKTYKDICHKLQLDDSDKKIKANWVIYNDSKVYKIHLFNIQYKAFGHIWFMAVHANFTKFDCGYEDFETELYTYYTDTFGEEVVSRLPQYDDINCNYIEYSTEVEVANSDTTIEKLGVKCTPEQLDKTLWHHYKKPHGTIATCFNKKDGTHIEMLARCHGTALKKKIRDKSLHRGTGLTPNTLINLETENLIISKEIKKHLS